MPIRLSITNDSGPSGPATVGVDRARTGRAADEAGLDTLWVAAFDIPDGGETIRRKLAVLARHCEALGRPYEEIEKTAGTRMDAGEPLERLVARCSDLAALGIEHAVHITAGPWTEEAAARPGATREGLHA